MNCPKCNSKNMLTIVFLECYGYINVNTKEISIEKGEQISYSTKEVEDAKRFTCEDCGITIEKA